jgi:hypothetical protein
VHIRRQVKMVRTQLCFALPKGRKVRDIPLPDSVADALKIHAEGWGADSNNLALG